MNPKGTSRSSNVEVSSSSSGRKFSKSVDTTSSKLTASSKPSLNPSSSTAVGKQNPSSSKFTRNSSTFILPMKPKPASKSSCDKVIKNSPIVIPKNRKEILINPLGICSCHVLPRPTSITENIGQKSLKDNITLISHPANEFVEEDNVFDIEISAPQNYKFLYQLYQYRGTAIPEIEQKIELPVFDHVLMERHGSLVTFKIAVDDAAWYSFNIFASPGVTLPLVYTYLFEVTQITYDIFPFPKQFSLFTDSQCHLEDPLFIDPDSNLENVKFNLTVPKAKDVAVIAGNEWQYLESKGDNVWQGELDLEQFRQPKLKICINARMGHNVKIYASLLQYSL